MPPASAWCVKAYQPPKTIAATDNVTTRKGFSFWSTPSRCAKPRIQQKRYVDRSQSALPKRLSGPAQTNFRTTIGTRVSSSTGIGALRKIHSSTGESITNHRYVRRYQRISQACVPHALPGGSPTGTIQKTICQPGIQSWIIIATSTKKPQNQNGGSSLRIRLLTTLNAGRSSDFAISVPASPNMIPIEGNTIPHQAHPKVW